MAETHVVTGRKRKIRHRGRASQIPIYLSKQLRFFVYQSDWKVLPMAAVVAALIFRACRKKSFGFALLSAICGEIIMVLGYFVFEDFILGYGAAAAAEIPGNAAQAAVGIVGGLALYFALNKVPQIRDFSEAALAKKQK